MKIEIFSGEDGLWRFNASGDGFTYWSPDFYAKVDAADSASLWLARWVVDQRKRGLEAA